MLSDWKVGFGVKAGKMILNYSKTKIRYRAHEISI